MFQGPANVTLDTKGRFGVPARYRQDVAEASGGRVICTVHPDRCVLIYRPEDFARVKNDVAQQKGGRDVCAFLRYSGNTATFSAWPRCWRSGAALNCGMRHGGAKGLWKSVQASPWTQP